MITAGRVIAVFFSVAVFAPLMWFAMDRDPPYTFEYVEISPHEVVPGSEIYITFTVKQHRAACGPGTVYREFKEASGKLHIYDPIMRAEAPIPANNKFTRIGNLPSNITPGPTIYRGKACYTCNPVHSWLRWPVCADTPSVTFNVAEPKP